jgi:murein DD-endopeptidase MepM/ murein hydrolase activator NlpD
VRYAGSFGGRWGDCVILEHQTPDSGILTTLYGHINIAAGVEKGKVISQGTTLGTIDPSVQPPHLHFGIRMNPYDGLSIRGALFNCANADHRPKFPEKWVDPIRFLKDHPKAPTYVGPDRVLIIKGPFHLGDDVKDSEIHRDALFDYGQTESTLKLRVKGTPKKDPILWVNRIEVGRITTSDDEWHWHEFAVPKGYLRDGKNLFHIQSYIPDRWQTFDDCEVADVWIVKR